MRHHCRGALIAVDAESRESFLAEHSGFPYDENHDPQMGDVISVHADRLRILVEPSVRVCRICGCPENREDLKRRDGQPWGVCKTGATLGAEECDYLPAPDGREWKQLPEVRR
jgi:hypothetical protein